MTTPLAPPTVSPVPLNYQSLDPAVQIWNPNAASLWSLLFSPIFGAWLVAKNWDVLGHPDKARTNRVVAGVLLLIFLVLPFASFASAAVSGLSRWAGLACLLVWYFTWGKPQIEFVKTRFGKTYRRKGWGAPLGIALALTVAYYLFCFGTGVLLVLTHVIKT